MRYLLLALLLWPVPARAQSLLIPSAIYVASGQTDAWSTKWDRALVERNPVGQAVYHVGGRPAFVGAALLADTATAYAVARLGRHHRKLATVVLYSLAAVRFDFAVHNLQIEPPPTFAYIRK